MIISLDWRKIVLIILVIVVIAALINSHKDLLKIVYPIYYKSFVFEAAVENGLDPYLLFSVMYVESKFNAQAVSNRGARGLMQIMPQTGQWIAKRLGDEDFEVDDLYEPEVNIKYSSWYLARLKEEFNDRLPVVLAAYNGGQGNVVQWLEDEKWDGKHENLTNIPFTETRGYVEKVTRIHQRYKYIYDE
ncbi:MAG: lytic transglycosylase domain-containing protein [Halanaerobacter sp.]